MRTLVVSGEYPWPENSGSRLRLATVLRGLASCGPTELFAILPTARTDIDPPDGSIGLERVGHMAFDDRPPEGVHRLAVALSPSTPFELPRRDRGASLRALTRFARGRYDLVWYFGMRPMVLTGGLLAAPAVLDLVDLEDAKIAARLAIPTASLSGLPASATVLFQGTLRYPPNAEAARFLVGAVAPALRRLVPDVRVRLVGATTSALEALEDPPAVTLVGQVPDIAAELARADVVVVPIRFGSGTRLKVLEAFAQRVPVVATTLGAEGLGVEDGVHLLLADTAEGLAEACARLLADEGLRSGLVARGHELFVERYADGVVATTVADVAHRVAVGG
jgi:hypothetical protein